MQSKETTRPSRKQDTRPSVDYQKVRNGNLWMPDQWAAAQVGGSMYPPVNRMLDRPKTIKGDRYEHDNAAGVRDNIVM